MMLFINDSSKVDAVVAFFYFAILSVGSGRHLPIALSSAGIVANFSPKRLL